MGNRQNSDEMVLFLFSKNNSFINYSHCASKLDKALSFFESKSIILKSISSTCTRKFSIFINMGCHAQLCQSCSNQRAGRERATRDKKMTHLQRKTSYKKFSLNTFCMQTIYNQMAKNAVKPLMSMAIKSQRHCNTKKNMLPAT